MNRLTAIRTYEPVPFAEWSYVMTEADFPNGCHTRMTGRGLVGEGENKLGIRVSLPLNVRLCQGCDGIIVDSLCTDCELVFTNPPELQPDSKGLWL